MKNNWNDYPDGPGSALDGASGLSDRPALAGTSGTSDKEWANFRSSEKETYQDILLSEKSKVQDGVWSALKWDW